MYAYSNVGQQVNQVTKLIFSTPALSLMTLASIQGAEVKLGIF